MKKLLSLLVLTSIAQTTLATELARWHWPDRTFHISSGDLRTTTVGGGVNWDAVFGSAVARWNNTDAPVTITEDRLAQTQACTSTAPNTTYFSNMACDQAWPSGVVGVAVTWSITATGEAVQTSILFNNNESWAVYSGPAQNDVEFTRVAVHELGHAIGIGHTNDSRAIMFPVGSDVVSPQDTDVSASHLVSGVGKLAMIDDADTDGSDEVTLLRSRNDTGRGWVQLREVSNASYVQSMYLSEGVRPLDLFVVDDLDSDGIDEVAVFGSRTSDGRARLEVREPENRALISAYYNTANTSPIAGFALNDVNGSGTQNVALLITQDVDGRALIQVREANNGQHVNNIYFAPNHHPIAGTRVPDINGTNADEVAVLLVNRSTGVLRLEIRDGLTGNFIALLPMPSGYKGVDLKAIADVNGNGSPDVAALIYQDNAMEAPIVRVHDGLNGALINTLIWTSGTRVITEDALVVIPDISGNGISEVGVLLQRYSDNQPFVQLRDASTGALETLIQLGANSISEAMIPLADQNSNGAPEIAVLGYAANGTGRVRIYDSDTAQQLNSTILAPIPGTGI